MAAIKKLKAVKILKKHLLGIQDLSISDVNLILNESKNFINLKGRVSATEMMKILVDNIN